jgi:hypothetical protein
MDMPEVIKKRDADKIRQVTNEKKFKLLLEQKNKQKIV